MFISTLKPRTQDVLSADFGDVPYLDFTRLKEDKSRIPARELWNLYIPYTPAQIYSLFSEGFPHGVNVNMKLDGEGKCVIKLNPSNLHDWHADFKFQLGPGAVPLHSQIEVLSDDCKGHGIGTNAKRIYIEFGIASGSETAPFLASLDDGGHHWALFGADVNHDYKTSEPTDYELHNVTYVLKARTMAVRPYITDKQHAQMQEISQLKHADCLRRLAVDFRHVAIPVSAGPDIRQRLLNYYKNSGRINPDLFKDEKKQITRIFKRPVQSLPLPVTMLTGVRWPAIVDPRNVPQMEYIEKRLKRLGGWSTLCHAAHLMAHA